ncbi:MAG: ornithine carbamoyltransferase [Chromatiales bacterium]|nr:ornithine carbamoyltransferase [Chromatiales bacterium]
MNKPRHFLTLSDLRADEFRALIERAIALKKTPYNQSLDNKMLAMIFAKPSTRTRVSFETAMAHLGGRAIFLNSKDCQLGRGETIEDSARVLSQMVDAVMIRTTAHQDLELFARYATVPTINGLSDGCHPCQLLADMLTYFEKRGDIKGHSVAWVGDGNNVCRSYINAAMLLGFQLTIASPKGYQIDYVQPTQTEQSISKTTDPYAAVKDADLVVTDVWASMGQEAERQKRLHDFKDYRVTAKLMAYAKPDALFMHCLPAHRGEEVTAEVIDGEQSVVWEEAGNRLHAQKALLELLLN